MRRNYIGGLVGLLLITGCSIFERSPNSSARPEKPKEPAPQQSKILHPKQENNGSGNSTQTQQKATNSESRRAEKDLPEQIKEPSAELLNKELLNRELLNKELLNKELLNKNRVNAPPATPTAKAEYLKAKKIERLCRQLSDKLFSLSLDECLDLKFSANAISVFRRPLIHQDFVNSEPTTSPRKKIMIIGGIHGDEYSSISVVFKWMAMLQERGHSIFDWRFLPCANPDGLLRNEPQRQNANNVDLNRNFSTADWHSQAIPKWRTKYNSNPRRFPGDNPASEPEVKWIVQQIADFKPDAIISLHAPYGRVDFDGPPEGPTKLGALTAIRLGVFPGSLGNYSGVDLKIPTVTLELPSASRIPAKQEISAMWQDLQIWLCNHLEEQCEA